MLGVEGVLMKAGGDPEDLYVMMMLNNKTFYILGKLWEINKIDYLNGFTFMADHISTAASIVFGSGEKQEMSKEDDGIHVGQRMEGDENGVVIKKARIKKAKG